jgi:eukaryotic translation initiation factor 2C
VSNCTSAFFKPILVSDFLRDDTTFKNQQDRLAQLRGLRVHLTYDPVHSGKQPRSRTAEIAACIKTIAGTGKAVREQTFILKSRDGQADAEVIVQEHFARTYNATPLYPGMPAINCGTELRPMWYLPEKLQILPYQIYKRQVPESLTASILNIAAHHPNFTRALIEHEGLRHMGLNPGVALATVSGCPAVQIDSRMLQVPATVLPYPRPIYGNGAIVMTNPSWNLNNRKFLVTKGKTVLKSFVIGVPCLNGKSAFSDPRVLKQTWQDFSQAMGKTYTTATFYSAGFTINPNLRDAMNQAKASGANFVMLVLEKKSIPTYSAFKDMSDRQYGMHSLCVVYDWKKGFSPQYWGNSAMKMNLKAGGINHTADGVEQIMKDTLVLGA